MMKTKNIRIKKLINKIIIYFFNDIKLSERKWNSILDINTLKII